MGEILKVLALCPPAVKTYRLHVYVVDDDKGEPGEICWEVMPVLAICVAQVKGEEYPREEVILQSRDCVYQLERSSGPESDELAFQILICESPFHSLATLIRHHRDRLVNMIRSSRPGCKDLPLIETIGGFNAPNQLARGSE